MSVMKISEVKKGEGKKTPEQKEIVMVHYQVSYKIGDDTTIVDDTFKRKQPIKFEIGKNQVVQGLEKAVKEMKVGEISIFEIPSVECRDMITVLGEKKIPSGIKKFTFKIELLSSKIKTKEEDNSSVSGLTFSELMKKCGLLKEEGNELYKEKKHEKAMKVYKRSILLLEEKKDDLKKEELEELNKLKISCYLNISACTFKMENWKNTIDYCSRAITIDEKNMKGYYRRGQAYQKEQEFDKSMDDYSKAIEVCDKIKIKKTIQNNLSQVKKEKKRYESKMKSKYSKMFN